MHKTFNKYFRTSLLYSIEVIIFSLFFYIFPKEISAQVVIVVINEVSVAPENKYDWIELYSPDTIDISGWKVADEAGVFEIIPSGTILGEGIYYVVTQYQRLDNEHDTVFLLDNVDIQKDFIKYGYEGEICTPEVNGSIVRIPDANSHYYTTLISSKGSSNNNQTPSSCPTPTTAPTSTNTPTPTHTPTPLPSPTPRPTNTPTPIKTPTPLPTQKELVEENSTNEKIDAQREVLGSQESEKEAKDVSGQGKKVPLIAIVIILVGVIFMGISVFPFVKSLIKKGSPL